MRRLPVPASSRWRQKPRTCATVERGFDWIEEHYELAPDDWWFLAPGDHPAFSATVVRDLLAARRTTHSIIVPTHGGRRGHPALLRWRHAAGIRALSAGAGINSYLRSQCGSDARIAGERSGHPRQSEHAGGLRTDANGEMTNDPLMTHQRIREAENRMTKHVAIRHFAFVIRDSLVTGGSLVIRHFP